ncbi:unnamed protein product [Prunus armeniaca]|uniref:Uncharacterized protein n=1 Tax=Prunus armeniaca TaxID=36596 RepID=A0A6J5UJG8_PRUAR|nr:unnamed protein product [Prunus armeniaca]
MDVVRWRHAPEGGWRRMVEILRREAGGLGGSGLKVVPTTEYQKSEYRVGNRREGRYATQQTKQQPTLYVCRNDGV